MSKVKVGINGFGRTGRSFARIAFDRNNFDLVAINTRSTTPEMLSYLLKYDSVHGTYPKEITHDENNIYVDGKQIHVSNQDKPENIPWEEHDIEIVVDATGAFKTKEDLSRHIKGSVKKVLLTCPAKGDDINEFVMGCTDEGCLQDTVVSNASCTTNCAVPLIQVLDEEFGVDAATLTTIHAYTSSQNLLDDRHKKFTRSRAAALNIIPTTTGAAKSVVKAMPHLKGKVDGMAVRVPVPSGSFTDITLLLKEDTTVEEINAKFKEYSETKLKGILGYEETPLVSIDYIGTSFSTIFDPNYTQVLNGKFVKITGWYDNEYGYSTRLVDVVEKLAVTLTK